MKQKLTLVLIALFTTVGAWADVLPSAVVGTTAFQATALTTGASDHTISKDGSGNVTISPNNGNLGTYPSNYLNCTLVVKINVPSTTTAGVLCQLRKTSEDYTAAQGLYMDTDRKLTTSWGNDGRKSSAGEKQLDAGEHTIIFTANSGANVYIDGTEDKLTDGGLRAGSIYYTAIYIPAAYAQYVTEVHFYSSIQNETNITSIVTECSNHMHASQQAGTTASVASEKTLILDKAVNWTSLTGSGTVLQEVDINTTVAGNLPALTLKATAGTLTYTGSNLNGTTLDGVILEGTNRITTTNTVTIKNLAGNNLNNTSYNYAFVGSGTLNFYGTCDLTKKSDGTSANENCKLGYGSSASINIKEGANVTTGAIFNTTTSTNNAMISIESGATLNATAEVRSISAINQGTMIGTSLYGPITLNNGSTTTFSGATPFNDNHTTSGDITVSGDATLNLTATTATLNKAITVAADKTLTIDCKSNAVNLNVVPTLGSGSNVNVKNFTIDYAIRDLPEWTGYTFTSCTAKFIETTDEYKAGGFTITNIPDGVTVKVKKYDATDYETVTPEAGTATISHEVGVSGLAAWLDYTFNESTKATNIHSPADQVITNAGNAGSGNNLNIDGSYTTATSYNEDGTLKVMSTPWRNITWPTNYTVAVAGNVPDVENGCLVAFGSTTAGSKNYLAIIRGASQNEIKLVKGHEMNSAFEVISTMTAANATALSHLVVFTKNGNTFTVYLDGVQKTQVTYSDALGGGFQIGSLHGGVTGTGVGRVNDMSDDIKAKVFAKAIRVYDYVISSDQMEALTAEFPYTSFGGKYSRTITENSNLSATDAWLNTSTQGNVDVPENATVDAVTYYPDVEITTTAASTLTVNADMDADNIKFDGAGKLTIASDGEHNIHIYGSLTANGPISVKYGETDLSAVPVTIGESGSIEFDFSASASAFSDVTTSTDYPVTANTADYGSKVTGVYPSDTYHIYSLAYNNSTSSYCLTVAPSVALKQQMAINLVQPYYDNNLVGTSIGRYTISLGETSYADFADFGTEVMSWETIGDCVEPTITLNTPSAGFYRLRNVATDKYLTAISGPYGYTSAIKGVYANGDANSAATVIRLYDKNGDGKLYMYNQGNGFGWTDANKVDGSGAVGYLSTNPDKYVNWFPGTASGQIGFAICYGNGTGSYASYLETGIYTVDTDDESVIAGTDSRANAAQWIVEEATSVTVAMHSDGAEPATYYATFCAPFSYTVTGAKAYTLAKSDNVLNPTEVVGAVPAGKPVLLQGSSSTATLTISGTDYAATPLTSDLTGTYLAKTINGGSDYVLGINGGVVGFYHWNSNNLGANRAYVAGGGSSVKGYVLNFDDDATAIEMVNGQSSMVNGQPIYNLAGQRISKMQKGINIVNGKKIMVK